MFEISTIIKGFIIGGSMLIPGVSGGTMSMIFKVYDRMISSVSSFMKHKKESFFFLLQFVLGAGAAFLILSGPMASLNRHFPQEMGFFVIGAVIGGIPVIYKETRTEHLSFKSFLYLAAGLALVFSIAMLPKNLFHAGNGGLLSFLIQFLAGILGALALVLPGISFSSMLYMMGVYNFIFGALGDRNFLALFPFGAGCILGILLLTRFLETAMKRYPHPTYMIILGFVMGSIGDIMGEIPRMSAGIEIFSCIFWAAAGFFIIYLLSRWEERHPETA